MPVRKWLLGMTLALMVFVSAVILFVQFRHVDSIYPMESISSLPHREAVLILGASVTEEGSVSDALGDRLLIGKEIFDAGKSDRLLITGDGGAFRSAEIPAMRAFLIAQGMASSTIQEDPHGYRTYESCKRAAQEFGIHSAILVTQRFHLARALYLCESFGIDSVGVEADRQPYVKIVTFWIRDLLASFKAWVDLNVWAPDAPVKA